MSNYLQVVTDFVVEVAFVAVVAVDDVLIGPEEIIHVVFVKALLVVFSIVLVLRIVHYLVV